MDLNGSLIFDSDNLDEFNDTDNGKPPNVAAVHLKQNKTLKISALIFPIYAHVDLLYYLALLLCRLAVMGRYIKSVTKRAEISVFT